MVLLSTSPGKGGGRNVLNAAGDSMPHFGGKVKACLSIPSFHENFDLDSGQLTNEELDGELKKALTHLVMPS